MMFAGSRSALTQTSCLSKHPVLSGGYSLATPFTWRPLGPGFAHEYSHIGTLSAGIASATPSPF